MNTPLTVSNSQCSTGAQYCCNSVQSSKSPAALAALGLVGAVVDAVVDVGLACDPITVIGLAGGSSWYVPGQGVSETVY